MNRAPLEPNVSDLEPFFAAERELPAEPEELRGRVLERAWASLRSPPPTLPIDWRPSRPRRVKVGLAAAAAVTLSAMCALAFLAGYHAKTRNSASSAQAPSVTPSTAPQPPAPSIVVAIVPVMSAQLLSTSSEPATASAHPEKPSSIGSAKVDFDIEAYGRELRVLQPARQAVARGDFNSALAAITKHQTQFPAGRLAEEREALRVRALLGLGRSAEAKRAGTLFRARFPHSALTKRMDEVLETRE